MPATQALGAAASYSLPKAMPKCNADPVCTRALSARLESNMQSAKRMDEVAKVVRKEYNQKIEATRGFALPSGRLLLSIRGKHLHARSLT